MKQINKTATVASLIIKFNRIEYLYRLKQLSCLFIFLISFKSYSQLSGTYTVGGSSPNFPTLDSAFNYMEIKGVSGKVRLNVRSGVYTLRTTISAISGASATKSIQVAPDPTNTTPVIFKNKNTSSSNNFLVNFKQGFIRFDSLQFRIDSSSTYGSIITFGAICSNITINACTFYGRDTTATTTNFAIIFANPTYRIDFLKILNSTILNGSYAIYLEGPNSSTKTTNNEVRFNKILRFYYRAVYLHFHDYLIVEGNYVKDINKYPGAIGLYFKYDRYAVVSGNQVYINGQSGYGVYTNLCTSNSSNQTRIYNNFICGYDGSKNGAFTGLHIEEDDYIELYFNTIVTFNKASNSKAFNVIEVYTSKNAVFKNNIFYAENGLAIDYGSNISKIKSSDHNLLYSGGLTLINYLSAISDLAAFQKQTHLDSHSVSNKIDFESLDNLHTISIDAFKNGVPISWITNDIDGQIRKTNTPDIGADEFRPPSLDMALTQIESNFCMGINDVYVNIKNKGLMNIDSCKLMWQISVNGGSFVPQKTFTYYGTLTTGKDTFVKIGNYNYVMGNACKIKAWVNSPNNTNDTFSSNDTNITKILPVSVKGTFTIGGSNPNFPTIDSAINTLERGGVCGPVKLLVRSGTYNERVVFNPINGLSETNNIQLVSDPANTSMPLIYYNSASSADNSVLLIKNVSYITIEGLIFKAISASYGGVVHLNGNYSHINFINDSLIGIPTHIVNNPEYYMVFDSDGATGSEPTNIVIKNCVIRYGSYGIYIVNAKQKETNLQIIQNRIINFSYFGMYITDQKDHIISNNYLKDNNLNNIPVGIQLELSPSSKITNNELYIGGRKSPCGIKVIRCNGVDTNPVLISNNYVSMYNNLAFNTVVGIYVEDGYKTRILHNTVHLAGGDSTSKALYAAFYSSGTAEIYNNTFTNYSKGYAGYFKIAANKVKSNQNNFYTNGKYLGFYYSNCLTLKDLRTASNNESNSISFNPFYLDPIKLKQKLQEFDSRAIPLSDVKSDFYGTKRDTISPDIGAYEFEPYSNDLQLRGILLDNIPKDCGTDSAEILLVIRNNGLDSHNNFKLNTIVTGSNSQQYKWADTFKKMLQSGAEDTFKLSKFRTTEGGIFKIRIFIDSMDNDQWNDTAATETGLINSSPGKLQEHTDTICDNITHQLITNIPSQSFLKWYSKRKGGKLIAKSDTLTVKNIKTDSTLYASAVYTQVSHVGVLNAGPNADGNSCNAGGVMFNLQPKVDMNLDSIYANFKTAGLQTILIYIKRGTYKGYEQDTSSWKLADTSKVTTPYGGIYKTFKLTKPIFLEKDSLYGVYIYYDTKHFINYPGDTFVSNDLTMISGSALCYKFSSPYAGWHFPGKIYYSCLIYCESERAKYTIKINKSPVINIGKDTAYCANSGMNLLMDPGPGYKYYKWSNGDSTRSIYAKDGGAYWVQVTNNNLCKDLDTLIITKNYNPSIDLGPDINYCADAGINIILRPGVAVWKSYLWSNGYKLKNLKVTAPGVYSIIVTDINNCQSFDTATVTKINVPVVSLGNDTFYCSHDGLNLLLDAGKGYKYKWSNTDSTSSILVKFKGKYFVEVEDSFTCKASDTLNIIEKISPVIQLGNDTIYCKSNGIYLKLDAGAGFKDYTWSTSDNNKVIFISEKGVYSVVATGLNGCIARDTIFVNERTPEINLGKDTGYCIGNTINLTLDAGAGNISYKWSTSEATQTINVKTKGAFNVSVTDSMGCKGADTILVSEINTKINLGNDTSYCENSGFNKQLDAGQGYLEYTWKSGKKTQIINVSGPGTYSVTAMAKYGCYGMDTIVVTKNINPVVNLGTDRVLNPLQIVNETLNAGSGFTNYYWNTTETSQSISVSMVGNYSVVVSDKNNCKGKDSILVRYWNPTHILSNISEDIKIYPNPANNIINIISDNFLLENIKIYTITGKEVYSSNPKQKSVVVNSTDWSNGVYLITFELNGNKNQVKWIINH